MSHLLMYKYMYINQYHALNIWLDEYRGQNTVVAYIRIEPASDDWRNVENYVGTLNG